MISPWSKKCLLACEWKLNKITGVATWSIVPASTKELELKKTSFYTCIQCYPALSCHADTFKGMVYPRSWKKAAKSLPKSPWNRLWWHHQAEWVVKGECLWQLRQLSLLVSCIRPSLGISKDRITCQHSIKWQQLQEPIVSMSKSEVEAQCLSDYIIMTADQ